MTVFSQRLKELREGAGYYRTELSEICGLDRSAIAEYEESDRLPKLKSIIAIADLFEVSIDYLVGR